MRENKYAPKTIEEMREYCQRWNLPLEQMRFFIGEDYKGARAFGIYKEADGTVVVYKNKADGSRAVRYRGYDEAYAVKEIFEKLYMEIETRRVGTPKRKNNRLITMLVMVAVVVILSLIVLIFGKSPERGYYRYNNNDYYYQDGDWYLYTMGNWMLADAIDDALNDNYDDYYNGENYNDGFNYSDFSQSGYYNEDTDSGVDFDNWDSGVTDWNSDW